jgi:TonB family protein
MKRILLFLIVIQLLTFSVVAQISSENKEKLAQANQQLMTSYKAGRLDEALKFARESVDLTLKTFGADHAETATAYVNLGTIYRLKKRYDDAAENLQKAVNIYNLKPGQNGKSLAKALDGLAFALALSGEKKRAEENYLLALTAAENAFGKEAKDVLPYLKSLADFYVFAGKPAEAQQIFTRRYLTAAKYFQPDGKELQEIEDNFYCSTLQNFPTKEANERQKKFNEAIQAVKITGSNEGADGKIINSKAKLLAKPEYPPGAKARNAQGTIAVRVVIDEQGKVTEAKSICNGDAELLAVSEQAARQSEFSPTLLNGTPVKVTGIVVYRFVR